MKSGPIFILTAAILWGLDGILRRSLYELSPITIVFYEHLLGTALILPFALKNIKTEKLTRSEWGVMALVSMLSGILGTLWFTKALLNANFVPFSVVYLLQKLQPLFAIGAARLLLKEKITLRYIGYASLAIGAAYFVTFKDGRINWQNDIPLMNTALLAIGAAFAWGSSTAFSKFNLKNHSQETITGLRFALTTTFAAIWIMSTNPSDFGPISLNHIGKLIAISCSTGLVALWLYYKGLKQTKAQISTILELAFPATAVVIDVFLYKNILSLSQYLAAAVLVFAITKLSKQNTS